MCVSTELLLSNSQTLELSFDLWGAKQSTQNTVITLSAWAASSLSELPCHIRVLLCSTYWTCVCSCCSLHLFISVCCCVIFLPSVLGQCCCFQSGCCCSWLNVAGTRWISIMRIKNQSALYYRNIFLIVGAKSNQTWRHGVGFLCSKHKHKWMNGFINTKT